MIDSFFTLSSVFNVIEKAIRYENISLKDIYKILSPLPYRIKKHYLF
ncbi:hypothetical protein KPK_3298 [Klebsiella variicola]|uniref:Uncharacterized protein n=1 Tax=Klebsiella variicola (strain 342) TaxID=507522 RepID=B5XSC3_KLEV3|nr:hypothetical protein KPK_3298 [Klebsiella variicola]